MIVFIISAKTVAWEFLLSFWYYLILEYSKVKWDIFKILFIIFG